jgi:pimeloyl-ACP methyl ester carboxylesterase
MIEKFTIFRDKKIYYRVAGKGFPVMLVHGFAEDGSIWDSQVKVLKDNYNLVIPDLPGSGKSELIDGDHIGLEDYAEAILQILTEEGIARCIMIGHSMGGYITLAFAEKHPSLLEAIGLFHSSAYADDDEKVKTRKKAIEFIKTAGAWTFLKTSIPGLFFSEGNSGPADALIEKGRSFTADALIQYYEAMIARPDRIHVLKKINRPVLFIIGAHDKAVPFSHGLEQSHIPANSYVYILRQSAHMGMLEETEKASQILTNFLLYEGNIK